MTEKFVWHLALVLVLYWNYFLNSNIWSETDFSQTLLVLKKRKARVLFRNWLFYFIHFFNPSLQLKIFNSDGDKFSFYNKVIKMFLCWKLSYTQPFTTHYITFFVLNFFTFSLLFFYCKAILKIIFVWNCCLEDFFDPGGREGFFQTLSLTNSK